MTDRPRSSPPGSAFAMVESLRDPTGQFWLGGPPSGRIAPARPRRSSESGGGPMFRLFERRIAPLLVVFAIVLMVSLLPVAFLYWTGLAKEGSEGSFVSSNG